MDGKWTLCHQVRHMLPCKAPHMGGALMLYGYGLDTLQQRHFGQSRTGGGCSDWVFGTAMLRMLACLRACVHVSVCKIQEYVG